MLLDSHNYQVIGPKDRHLTQRCLSYRLTATQDLRGVAGEDGPSPLELSIGPLRVDLGLKSQKVEFGF